MDENRLEDDLENMEVEQEPSKKKRFWSIFKMTKGDGIAILVSVICALLIVHFIAQPVLVQGESMNETLYDGERLMIEKVSRYYQGLERFDIVVLKPHEDDSILYIKRIIGMPGETLQIKDGAVYINGELLEEDVYGDSPMYDYGRAEDEVVLGEDEYFVMGDNRAESLDSRYEEVGNVKLSQIQGRVVFQMFPFQKVE